MRISDWSSDVCSSDLNVSGCVLHSLDSQCAQIGIGFDLNDGCAVIAIEQLRQFGRESAQGLADNVPFIMLENCPRRAVGEPHNAFLIDGQYACRDPRSAEHTSELQSLMRLSYAVFCLKKKNYSNRN